MMAKKSKATNARAVSNSLYRCPLHDLPLTEFGNIKYSKDKSKEILFCNGFNGAHFCYLINGDMSVKP